VIDGSELSPSYHDIGFFDIDRRVFREQYSSLSEVELGSSRLSLAWYQRNPSIYTVLLAGDQVVGYCNTMPLKEAAFNALVRGELGDGEIEPDMIELFDAPGNYRVFCCGIAILEEYRSRGLALRTLLMTLFHKFAALADSGCWISEIAAVAWTADGRELCEGCGLRRVSSHEAYGDVYYAKVGEELASRRETLSRRLGLMYQRRGARKAQ